MKVPLLDLQAQLQFLQEDLINAVARVVKSTRYIQGPEVSGIEEEIARYCDVGYGVGVSSGTDALLISLMALEVGQGDRVLTSPYSFFATMGVILRVGAEPVFADIDPETFNIDPAKVAEVLKADKERTIKAIIPVHLYGQCVDMTEIMTLANHYGIPVIEDAAQAIGAQYPFRQNGAAANSHEMNLIAQHESYVTTRDRERCRQTSSQAVDCCGDISPDPRFSLRSQDFRINKCAGSMGLCGCLSFFPSKNLGGIGDGGMVITEDVDFREKLVLLRNHGAKPKYFHSMVGGNFRLDPIQAAALRVKLPYLNDWHNRRAQNAALYKTLFAATPLIENENIVLPVSVYDSDKFAGRNDTRHHIYNQYILRVKRRDGLKDWLTSNTIGCEIYYPIPLHKQECLGRQLNSSYPEAERAARDTIALPIYPELTPEMQAYVVEKIVEFYV